MTHMDQKTIDAAIRLHEMADQMRVVMYTPEEIYRMEPGVAQGYLQKLNKIEENYKLLKEEVEGFGKENVQEDIEFLDDFFIKQTEYIQKSA